MLTIELLLVSVILILIIYCVLIYNYNFWKRLGIPYEKSSLLFGNIKDFMLGRRHILYEIDDIYKSHPNEPYVGYFQLLSPNLLIRDPKLIGQLLIKEFPSFNGRGGKFDEKLDPLSAHLVNLSGERWKMVRTKLTPTFTSGKLKLMYNLVNECVNDLDEHFNNYAEKQEIAEMKEIMSKFTTDVIGRCAFGLDFNSLKDPKSEYREIGKLLFSQTFLSRIKNIIRMINPKILHVLKLRSISERVHNFFMNLMNETITYRKQNNIQRNDFMQLMINIRDEEKSQQEKNKQNDSKLVSEVFSDHLLAANMFIFYIAGFETTATSLSYCFYELALNPDIQSRLRDEINRVCKNHNGIVNYDTLTEMTYMDMVISETLRKYNPAPFFDRVCNQTYQIPGTKHIIPAGVKITVSAHSLHHDAKYYPDPDKFIPERFTEENISTRPQYTYLPFGDGPRICIGLRFAKLEMKACLASIITKYEFSPCKETVVPIRLKPRSVLYTPDHGIWVSVTKIK